MGGIFREISKSALSGLMMRARFLISEPSSYFVVEDEKLEKLGSAQAQGWTSSRDGGFQNCQKHPIRGKIDSTKS